MEQVSRRNFIKGAGAIAAVAGSAAVVPNGLARARGRAGNSPEELGEHDGDIVAHLQGDGKIMVFFGDSEVTLVDASVASRLIRATRQGGSVVVSS